MCYSRCKARNQQDTNIIGVVLDKAWIKVISVTGAVGVIGFLFSTLMLKLFSQEILSLLGSEKIFYIIVLLIGVFAIGLIIAILKPKAPDGSLPPADPNKKINIKYESSTHNGDNRF